MDRVTCSACGKSFDALKAQDCSCEQPLRSVQCPSCGSCFCGDAAKLEKFWASAGPEMRARRRNAVEALPAGETFPRPLVLFADDDRTGRTIAAKVVESLGFGVIVAANGEEALAMARAHKPELIITDALMPRLDGREMSRVIKRELPETKIVVVTSVYKDPRYKHEALRDFAVDAYLQKPIDALQLREIVTRYLGTP